MKDFIRAFKIEGYKDMTEDEMRNHMAEDLTQYTKDAEDARSDKTHNYMSLMKPFEECGHMSILDFWRTEGKSYPYLQRLAVQVFNLVCSSATSERNFSDMAFVHSKLRNSLSFDRVHKLVYVRTNYKWMSGDKSCLVTDESDDDDM
jgi:hypothetical protein